MSEKPKIGPKTVHLITDPQVVKIFFDPFRRQILQTIVDEPRTVGQIAEVLELDFRKLYYHVKLLEKHGLIQLVDRQLISGAVEEKYYQISAYQFVIAPELLTFKPEEVSSLELDELHRLESDVVHVLNTPEPSLQLHLVRGCLNDQKAEEFKKRMKDLVTEFLDDSDITGTRYGLFTGYYLLDS